jgi:hypothetical protein
MRPRPAQRGRSNLSRRSLAKIARGRSRANEIESHQANRVVEAVCEHRGHSVRKRHLSALKGEGARRLGFSSALIFTLSSVALDVTETAAVIRKVVVFDGTRRARLAR